MATLWLIPICLLLEVEHRGRCSNHIHETGGVWGISQTKCAPQLIKNLPKQIEGTDSRRRCWKNLSKWHKQWWKKNVKKLKDKFGNAPLFPGLWQLWCSRHRCTANTESCCCYLFQNSRHQQTIRASRGGNKNNVLPAHPSSALTHRLISLHSSGAYVSCTWCSIYT